MEKSWENYGVPKSWKISYEKIMGKHTKTMKKSWEIEPKIMVKLWSSKIMEDII